MRDRIVFFALLFLGLLAYGNAVFHPFVHDEIIFIRSNPSIAHFNLKEMFLTAPLSQETSSLANTYYRPVLELVNRILFRIFHMNPFGYHLVNIFFHVFNSFLIYLLVLKIFVKRKSLGLAVSVLFLLHPIQTEAAACISGISNTLMTFFCLLSLLLYESQFIFYGFSLAVYFAALLTKEQAAIFPFVIFLYEFCLRKDLKQPKMVRLLRCLGFFVVLGGYLSIRNSLFGFSAGAIWENKFEFYLRMLAIPQMLLTYLSLIIFPHNLHYYRNVDILAPYLGPMIGLGFVILAAAGIIYFSRRKNILIFGLGWFLVSLLPTLNIFPIVNEYSFLMEAEHFVYFPLIGILIFFVGVWEDLRERLSIRKAGINWNILGLSALGIVSLFFMIGTIKQNGYWKNDIVLFERTVQFEKNFGRGRMLLAKSYAREKEWEKALSEYAKALSIMQGYLAKVKPEESKDFYRGFIKEIHGDMAYCYAGLGYAYIQSGRITEAAFNFEKAAALNGLDLMTKNSLAICYKELGRLDEAEALLREIAQKDAASLSAKRNLEDFLEKRKKDR